jgi:hypothetical protein
MSWVTSRDPRWWCSEKYPTREAALRAAHLAYGLDGFVARVTGVNEPPAGHVETDEADAWRGERGGGPTPVGEIFAQWVGRYRLKLVTYQVSDIEQVGHGHVGARALSAPGIGRTTP